MVRKHCDKTLWYEGYSILMTHEKSVRVHHWRCQGCNRKFTQRTRALTNVR